MSYDTYHKRKIGDHVLKPETQMMGFGYDPILSEGALKPPIFLTSTFAFKTAQDGKDFFDLHGRAPPAGGRPGGGTGVFALQQSESGSAGGSARPVGGGRIRGGILERHGGDFHGAVGPCASRAMCCS